MKFVVDDLAEEKRLDVYLAELLQEFSRSKIQNLIKKNFVTINYGVVKPSYIIKAGDIIEVNIEENIVQILPENIPLEILYDDDNISVVNKPSGMLTHPTSVEKSGTLVNALLYKYGNNLSDVNGEFRRGIIHRLDRNTSGLLIIAKNNQAHEYLVDKMKNRMITKKYLAIVKGVIIQDEFTINKPIGRNVKQPQKMCIDENGKESISKIKVLQRFQDATLIEIQLITGRTHQIRVHMSSIGHPVYNDTLYGFGKMKIKTEEQVLQSYKLEFNRPFDDKLLSFEADKDKKINMVLNFLAAKQ